MLPELSRSELMEILLDAQSGADIPDIDSPTQVETWRAEREAEAA